MRDWMDGWERLEANARPGDYVIDVPWRIVLHSTEGDSFDAAVRSYTSSTSWPHGTADPKTRRRGQHYPLSVSSRALMNQPGGVETNRERVIQIELVMHADEAADLTADELAWIGTDVVGPIIDALDGAVVLEAPAFVGREAGFIARDNAPQRFSYDAWLEFNGVCGHQHVPENDHWDPGHLDIGAVLRAAGHHPTPAPSKEDDMPTTRFVKAIGEAPVFLAGVDPNNGATHVPAGKMAMFAYYASQGGQVLAPPAGAKVETIEGVAVWALQPSDLHALFPNPDP